MTVQQPSLINLTEMDYSSIRRSLREFMESQSEFTDYNFEGSALTVLINLLANNTAYAAYMTNMLANESFLDTAQKRESVVSLAKMLGYTPNSITNSRLLATLTVVPLTGHQPDTITVPGGTSFRANYNQRSYNFVLPNTVVIPKSGSTYVRSGLTLVEGVQLTSSFVVDSQNPNQVFDIPNQDVDLSTLVVRINDDISDSGSGTLYTRFESLDGLGSDSYIYFVEETDEGVYRIRFGDGLIGFKPTNGNVIRLSYLVGNGDGANGLGETDSISNPSLVLSSGLASYTISNTDYETSNINPVVTIPAFGGANRESIESIRYNSPLSYAANHRAVTAEDFKALIRKQYPFIESCQVWGGEDEDPVAPGFVYISVKPFYGQTVSEIVKEDIINTFLNARVVATIQPVFVDPVFTYIILESQITYDLTQTNETPTQLETLTFDTIRDYGDLVLEKFGEPFRLSRLSLLIDSGSTGIISNQTTVLLRQFPETELNQSETLVLDFNNPIYHPKDGYNRPVLESSAFQNTNIGSENYYLDDDGSGIIRIYYLSGTTRVYVDNNAGTVVYNSGKITIPDFVVTSLSTPLSITVQPEKNDIHPSRNQLLAVSENDINITTKARRT